MLCRRKAFYFTVFREYVACPSALKRFKRVPDYWRAGAWPISHGGGGGGGCTLPCLERGGGVLLQGGLGGCDGMCICF